ncbi:MAG TPA: nitroreductase family protein [Actinomycetota bacterium]|nr:nitroreductase family protein [Actinomycetota bacterium]
MKGPLGGGPGEPPHDTASFLEGLRSIRRFDDRDVPDEVVRRAIEIGQRAPSASNHQPYSVIVVKDRGLRHELETTLRVQRFVEDAPVFLVVCVDWSRQDAVALEVGGPTQMNQLSRLVIGMTDCSIFAHHLTLALMAFGLGVCFVANPVLALDETARILSLPKISCVPLHVVVAGYPAEDPPLRPRYPTDLVVFEDRGWHPPDVDAVRDYLRRGDERLREESYFEVTGDDVGTWYEHYAVKYGDRALNRTWAPLASQILGFLDPHA